MADARHSPNLATDPAVQKEVKERFAPMMRRARKDRQLLTEQWLRYDNILKARMDVMAYHGRYRAYLAIGRRVIENWVTKLKQDLFPDSGKWFAINPESRDSEEGVEMLTALYKRYLFDYMRVRRKSGPILRQLVTLGTSPIDIGWRFAEREVPTLEKVWKDTGGNLAKSKEVVKKIVDYVGPTCRPIDLFRFYVYPVSVNDICDLTMLFEDTMLDQTTIQRLGNTEIVKGKPDAGMQFENLDQLKERLLGEGGDDRSDKEAKFQAERRRLLERGLRSPIDTFEDPNKIVVCGKAFWRVALESQGDTTERWYQVVTAGDDDIALQVRKAVFWDGEPSVLAPKFVEVLEEFYGYGLPGTFDSLAYMATDVLNQGADALTFSLNPIAAVDPGAVQDMTTVRMRPGAKWLVRRPRENIQFIEPPKESAAMALSSIQQLIALINDVSNVAPFSGGGMIGPRARGRALQTAGGMAQVAAENLVQVRDVQQGLEDLWLDPMLRKMYSRTQQCLDIEVMLNVQGAGGAAMIQRQVTRDDLIGEYTFRWLGTTNNYNLQVRGTQMVNFLQQVTRIPPELLQKENAKLDLKYILRMIWSEGLQLPEAERVIKDIQPVTAIDPSLENTLFMNGRADAVYISPADDDQKHLSIHDQLLKPGMLPPDRFQTVVKHMQEHLAAMKAKEIMQQMQQMGQLPGPGGSGGPGGGPQPPMNPGRPAGTGTQGNVHQGMERVPGGMGG